MKMNDKKKYERNIEFQRNIIIKQSEKIKELESRIAELELKCEEKDREIMSVSILKEELTKNVEEIKEYRECYMTLLNEIRKMKDTINKEVYKGKWSIIKFLIK